MTLPRAGAAAMLAPTHPEDAPLDEAEPLTRGKRRDH